MKKPDLSSLPGRLKCIRTMTATPEALYPAWTSKQIERWFAAPGTALMKPDLDIPYFFETHFESQRHPHHGRFLRLEPNGLVEMTWLTAMGTQGVETVLTIEFIPAGSGTQLLLTHSGCTEDEARKGHEDAWPVALEHLDKAYGGPA